MKRVFQFSAVAVAMLLAVQPALAGAACATSGMARTACPMGMSEMGADCPIAHGLAADCGQDCCNHAAAKASLLPATPTKPRSFAARTTISAALEFRIAAVPQPGWIAPDAAWSSPPRYLLNRVFRI